MTAHLSTLLATLLLSTPTTTDSADVGAAWEKKNPGYSCLEFLGDGCIIVRTKFKVDGFEHENSLVIMLDRPVKDMYNEEYQMYYPAPGR